MANKGEWSELYAFFKLLADGRLYCGDGHLNRYNERYSPILEIFRNDALDRNAYKVHAAKNVILVAGRNINIEIPQERFHREASNLLEAIKNNGGDYDEAIQFMNEIDCGPIKAKSSDKADIRIVIHNLATGLKPELGYSIKSKLGSDSTLINSNKDASNFVFRIHGINDEQMIRINTMPNKFKPKFEYIRSIGGSWSFEKVSGDALRNNLTMLDLGMSHIVAACMEKYYTGQGSELSPICKLVVNEDPLKINTPGHQPMYEYKLKQFLLAFALGMTASSPWNGKFNANGGYIVVKEDGDVVCYHFFDRNELEEYLFNNTRFDTPSTTRHEFGKIYKESGNYYIKLNLQIRFK